MGLLIATLRKTYLIAYKNELEYKIQLITQAKIALTQSTNDLLNVGTDMDPDNPVVKQLEQRKERLNLLEKKLDMQMDEYKTKLDMVEKEIQSCDGMFKSNLESSFSYGGGR
ncbi:MAG TPA: hypothetical protein PLG15_05530 [Candidatus Gastranaerophilaceae bacterium]|nr:hypothetical protein [Candidatus Gastranaerophilaceae bacterium]HPT41825.1 hypothetical protein [Candidatus Gastranaerophilaceae bacterium]